MNRASIRDASKQWWPFVLLCVFVSARLIVSDSLPSLAPTISSLDVASGAACLLSTLVLFARRRHEVQAFQAAKAAAAGALLLCGPEMAFLLRPAGLTGSDLLLAGSLVPIVISVALATRAAGTGLSAKSLWPALAAPAALLLVLLQPRPQSVADMLTLLLLPLMTGVGAVLSVETASKSKLWWIPSSLGGACLVFCAAAAVQGNVREPFSVLGCGCDFFLLFCTLFALIRIGAARFSALYIAAPLLLLLYEFATLRPPFSIRMFLGVSLLAVSAFVILRRRNDEDEVPGTRIFE